MQDEATSPTATTAVFDGIASTGAIGHARLVMVLTASCLWVVDALESALQHGALPSRSSRSSTLPAFAQQSWAAGALQHASASGSAV